MLVQLIENVISKVKKELVENDAIWKLLFYKENLIL